MVFDTNYFGVLHWVEEWIPVCQKNQGARFVVTSSINAIFAPPTNTLSLALSRSSRISKGVITPI